MPNFSATKNLQFNAALSMLFIVSVLR